MSIQVQIAATIPEDVNERLIALSQSTGRSKDDLVAEALQIFTLGNSDIEAPLLSEADFLADIEEGLREAEAGNIVDHEEVVADFERRVGRRR